MAAKMSVLLLLGVVAYVIAAPASSEEPNATTAADDVIPILEVIEVDEIPVVEVVETTATAKDEAKETAHKVSKRSALRGDNPTNDLLANFDGLLYENGVSSLEGRRIKFLPTWLG